MIPLENRPQAKAWMAKVVKAAVAGKLGAAEGIMKWLKDLASVAAEHSNRLEWTTPTGWPWVVKISAAELASLKSLANDGAEAMKRIQARRTHMDLRNAGWEIETEQLADKNTVYRLVAPSPGHASR